MGRCLHVNAQLVRTNAPATSTLLDLLRDQLDLTATKPGCRTGDCGTCLVLLVQRMAGHDEPTFTLHAACLTPVAMAEGCQVITAEGLAAAGPGRVHRALRDAGAVQCGYCTPSVVVALTWALLTGADPTTAAAGTLCRCTGYAGFRRAIESLASESAPGMDECSRNSGSNCAQLEQMTSAMAPMSPDQLLPADVLAVARSLPSISPEVLDPAKHRWLAGGTDVLVESRHATALHRRPTLLARIPELCRIEPVPGGLLLGAAVTVAQLQAHDEVRTRWPGLVEHLDRFGSPAVRASATVGGNLVHASPAADLAVPLLALDASVVLRGPDGERRLPLDAFFLGPGRTARHPDEVLTGVVVPHPSQGTRLHLERVAKRTHDDIASVSLALRMQVGPDGCVSDVRAAAGGVAPIPLLLTRTAAVLREAPVDPDVTTSALHALRAEIAPIDDVRGSAAYKRALLAHLLIAALEPDAPGLAERMLVGAAP